MSECGTFTISSGGLCFGPLLDIYQASLVPIQDPPEPRPFTSGTIVRHQIDHNVPAEMGTWRTYPLTQPKSPHTLNAWFAAHEDVDPVPELTKLLRVAGSPYEYEYGNRGNSDATREECVLLVNRYDWLWSRNNDTLIVPEWLQSYFDTLDAPIFNPTDYMENGNTIGIVDYGHAQETIQQWSGVPSRKRQPSTHGAWLHLPDPEYMWVRFGFDDSYSRAKSMLFFTQRTDFFDTAFPGRNEPLRIWETVYERYQRAIYQGETFSGIEWLRKTATPQPADQDPGVTYMSRPPPLQNEALGPYEKDLHILKMSDLETVLASFQPREPHPAVNIKTEENLQDFREKFRKSVFSAPHEDAILDLMNELALSYLDSLLHLLPQADRTNSPELLFPDHAQARPKWKAPLLDTLFLEAFSTPISSPLDTSVIRDGISRFLHERSGGGVQLSSQFIAGLANVVIFIVTDLLDMVDWNSYGRGEIPPGIAPIITPAGIRMEVSVRYSDYLDRSSVYWYGRG